MHTWTDYLSVLQVEFRLRFMLQIARFLPLHLKAEQGLLQSVKFLVHNSAQVS